MLSEVKNVSKIFAVIWKIMTFPDKLISLTSRLMGFIPGLADKPDVQTEGKVKAILFS